MMTSSTAVEQGANTATPMNLLLSSKTVEENNCNCGETSVIVSASSEATTVTVSSPATCSPRAQRDSNDAVANPAQDENVRILLAQLYQSSARSRKLHRPSSSLVSSSSSSSSSTNQQEQQIWTEMKNAISSIEEWKFIHHYSNTSSYSTNSLSSMVSNDDDDDMSCNAVTAEELFDDDFFEKH